MSYEKRYPDWEEQVRKASATTNSAMAAAASLGIKHATYKRYAEKYGCYVTNQSGKGISKPNGTKFPLEDILAGLQPQYPCSKLRIRLLKENIFDAICNSCGLTEWLGKPIPLELEHKDGCHTNHRLENLELLCPNCHALTETYAGRNKAAKFNS